VRTPLNGVVGMADLLRGTPLTGEQEDYVTTLLEATDALRVVVDDVLDFSKIEAGQLRIENVELDLVTLARAAFDMFQQAAAKNDTALRLTTPHTPPVRVLGDPNRIRQVLINLLSNAVKFTKNGAVDVRLSVQDEGASRLRCRFDIEDTGVGISPEAQRLIFQPFAQADGSITRRFGGTGLGLSISRKLVDLMGGNIGFSSRCGVGSTFWFELPLDKVQGAGSRLGRAHSSLLPKSNDGWKILVAEDNPINQKVVVAMLHGLGANVHVVNNGREALESWGEGAYDLILMDCQMPLMGGIEATEVIRAREQGPRTPIVAMTAQAYARDRERCLLAGMDDYLAKPLTKTELKSTLAKWLRLDSTLPLAPPPDPPRPVVVDESALARLEVDLGSGGREVLESLISAFCSDFEATLLRLRTAVQTSDFANLCFEAHRVRSSTANLAAMELASSCTRLEECGRRADAAAAALLLPRLCDEYTRARAALATYLLHQTPQDGGGRTQSDGESPPASPEHGVPN
jgi:CheY-like chemotaxis protein/HPt (histidine-containing phosphotransfer) domain-containing protein